MKTIIAGSRGITNPNLIPEAILASGFDVSSIISGGARGVDQLAIDYAKYNKISYLVFLADWILHGKSAGYRRNVIMGEYADQLIAIWDGESKGTKHMIDWMKKQNKPVFIFSL